MKKVNIVLVFVFCALGISAQEKQFDNFQVVEPTFPGERTVWVIPAGFEEAFDSLRLEYKAKDINLHGYEYSYPETDSLAWWLSGDIEVGTKEGVRSGEACPEEWSSLIPAALVKRMREDEQRLPENMRISGGDYFATRLLVSDKGNVLAVYFEIDSAMLERVREDELQAICDGMRETTFDVGKFDFRAHTNKEAAWAKKFLGKQILAATTLEERRKLYDEFMEKRIPVRFGVLCAYLQKCQEPESHPVDWENDEWKSGFVFDRVRL